MAKTPDEIKAAALAECERLAPNTYPQVTNFIDGYSMYYVVQWHDRSGFTLGSTSRANGGLSVHLPKDADPDYAVWLLAYRILGLETRDAALESRCQHEDTRQLLKDALFREQADHARAAKLVEALDETVKVIHDIRTKGDNVKRLDSIVAASIAAIDEWKGGQGNG